MFIFQTLQTERENYFKIITVITQWIPLIITILITFMHWLLIQFTINTHFVYVAYREVTKSHKSCRSK